MSMVVEIAKFMGLLVDEVRGHRRDTAWLRQEVKDMAETLQSLKDKLAAQGAQIDQLAAAKTAQEQADLDAIGASIDENTAKLTAALAPAGPAV